MKTKQFHNLEIDHVGFMLRRLFQIRAEQGCGDYGAAGDPSDHRTTVCEFAKERVLQRQAYDEREKRLLL
jgi:hypothetical protein